ncbi:MAG: class B sortase [Erysipelotrichaceae bacterium]|nr:class B sortase [Erysipelotrichaceae bacterium]
MKKTVYFILMIFCLGVLGFSGWKLFTIWSENQTIASESSRLGQFAGGEEDDPNAFHVDFAKLKEQNPDICGWIIVPGTGISSAVVQGVNNDFYLTHTTLKEPNQQGAIFVDSTTPSDLSSDNTLIYGHSVDVGGMFTNLKNFENEQFFNEHPYFWYLTPEKNYKCEIWHFLKTNSWNSAYTFDFGDFRDAILDETEKTAMYTREMKVSEEDKFLTLSTCDLDYGFNSEQRLVLYSVLKPYDGKIYLN